MQLPHPAHRVRTSDPVKSRKQRHLTRAALEVLEDRRLLATVSGVAFDDLNQNAVQDAGEPGLAGQLIYVDANENGQFDSAIHTYTSLPQPPVEILDDDETEATLEVTGAGTIADLDVTLDITHPFTSDLDVFLIAPDGTSIQLFSAVGGGGQNFTNTILDDEATTDIEDGAPPFTGQFRPSGSLAMFDGKSADGTWRLRIVDTAEGDSGTLNRWSLTIDNGGESEPSALSDEAGDYALTIAEPGAYVVRTVLPAHRTPSTPPGGAATVTIAAPTDAVTVDFGSYREGFTGAGLPDASFGQGGIRTYPIAGAQLGGEALAVQPDGKLIVGGWIVQAGAGDRRFFVGRLNPDGSWDTSFAGVGYVATDFTAGNDEVRDVVIQEDGKIIAAGRTNGNAGDFAFARYNADGTLDTTFSGDGKATVDVSSGLGDVVTGLALQEDGKIVATGITSTFGSTNFATVRLNEDGTLDSTFAGTGQSVIDFLGGLDSSSDVFVDRDGKIVVVGGALPSGGAGGGYQRWVMLRYMPTGQLDSTFDNAGTSFGRVTHDFQIGAIAKTIAQQPDGKYLIGGLIDDVWTLGRFNNDGSLDTSFGTGGTTSVPALRGSALTDYGMAVQQDGMILLGGRHETDEGDAAFAVARFLPNGALDLNFGFDGVSITETSSGGFASDLAVQSGEDGGRVVLIGGSGVLTLVRYANDEQPGPAFAALVNGVLTLIGTAENDAFALSQAGGQFTIQFGQESIAFNVADVTGLELNGLDGDDTLTLDMSGGDVILASLTIASGNGDDKIALINGDGRRLTISGMPNLNGESVDLGTADMRLTGVDVAAVEALVKTARAGAVRWQGPGIGTSAATEHTGLAPVQQDADVLVKFSYNGDMNGDGMLNFDDYFRIDSNFLSPPAQPLYAQGDLNFDDVLNFDDYFLLDSAFLNQGAPLATAGALSAGLSATATDVTTSFASAEEERTEKRVARRSPAAESVLDQRTQRRMTSRRGR